MQYVLYMLMATAKFFIRNVIGHTKIRMWTKNFEEQSSFEEQTKCLTFTDIYLF